MNETQTIREFRYRVPWYMHATYISQLAMLLYMIVSISSIIRELSTYATNLHLHLSTEYFMLLSLILEFIPFAFVEIIFVLVARRAYIRVSDSGISMMGWHGREKEILWHDIIGIRTSTGNEPSSISTRDGKRHAIRWWIKDSKILLDEIISKAELTEAHKGWFSNTYTRSVG